VLKDSQSHRTLVMQRLEQEIHRLMHRKDTATARSQVQTDFVAMRCWCFCSVYVGSL